MSDWRIRPVLPGESNDIVRLWLESFWDSRYARRYHREHGKKLYKQVHGERLRAIMKRAETRVICDPEDEYVIWAFAVVEGPDVVHYAFAKRNFHRERLSGDMFRALLADRFEKSCTYTHELCEFKRYEAYVDGVRVPATWLLDEYAWSEREAA